MPLAAAMDVRTGVSVNVLQTPGESQMAQHMGCTGRVDEDDHIIMTSYAQYVEQVRAQDVRHLDENDLSPMILRALASGRSFSRMPFLRPPGPL